jgi:hypothetical protein
MMLAVLFLSLFLLVNNALLAVLWRQNQNLHAKLLRVVAKSATSSPAIVREVAPSPQHKTEELTEQEKERIEARRSMWRV